MASKHKSALWFLKQGFFEGIKSFKEFEAQTGKLADTVEMGDALEILVGRSEHGVRPLPKFPDTKTSLNLRI